MPDFRTADVSAGSVPVAGAGLVEEGTRTSLRLWLLPPLTLFLFLLHLAFVWQFPSHPLYDPGIGWHLTTGRYILETGSIPTHDLYSHTAAGREWIDPYWLFQVISAGLERLGGLPLCATVWVLTYASLAPLLLRRMLRMGVGLLPAFVFTLCAYGVLLMHSMGRPHMVTYVFFALLLERLDRVQRGELGPWSLWWVPPMMILWCNMHGGFVAGLALTAIFAGVAAVRFVVLREHDDLRRMAVFGGLLVAMGLATLVNPYGVRLHQSIVEALGMQANAYFLDFKSPNFHAGGISVTLFERLVLVLVLLLGVTARSISWVEAALLAFFLHQGLSSVRHITLFAIVAAPIAAREASLLLDRVVPRLQGRLARIAEGQLRLRSSLVWFPAACAVFIGLALAGRTPFATSLDDFHLSKGAAEFIAAHHDRFGRIFNTDALGGSLIYRFWPDVKVFIDDRIAAYGDDFVLRKYHAIFWLQPDWQDVLREYDVTAAVVASKAQCATLFRESPAWEVAYSDDLTTIFFRKDVGAGGRTAALPMPRRRG